MPDLRAHGAWINPPALPITSSNFHAVHALKRTHTHTHSPTLSLPPLPPSASPRYSWERTGASQTGDGRQGGRHSTQSDPRRRPSRIGPRHTHKSTHEQIWRDWVSHTRTHTHTLWKRHGTRLFILHAVDDSSSTSGTVIFTLLSQLHFKVFILSLVINVL